MGEGAAPRREATRAYSLTTGAFLACAGLAGFLIEGSFQTGSEIQTVTALGVEVNGWWSALLLLAGLFGLGFSRRLAPLFCLGSALCFGLLALAGFFGAHGGEPVPTVADTVPVASGNSVLALALCALAVWALASPARGHSGVAPLGRPKAAKRSRAGRRAIN